MTNEQIQALKAAAERAHGEEWQYMRPSIFSAGYITNDKGETIVNVSNGDVPANRVGFIELANPAAILSVLAERDADKALIAVYSDAYKEAAHEVSVNWEAATALAEENTELKRRIAELEARTLTVKLPKPFIKSMYGTPLYERRDIVATLAAAGLKLQIEE